MAEALPKLSRPVYLACLAVRWNPEMLALAPKQDHYTVVAEALLLCLVAGITGVAWAAFWAQFSALPFACACGILAFAFMFLIDSTIGASGWRLTGILRRPRVHRSMDYSLRLSARFAMTVILSFRLR